MAALFGRNRISQLAQNTQIHDFEEKIQILKSWHQDYHFGTLRLDNETSREQSFNAQIFGRVLGYVQKPSETYTFEPKASTSTGQIPDARIGQFDPGKSIDRTVAVVELKGAGVQLDKPQRSHSNLSPVQQGFKYRPQYRGCDFVIVSNFFELRLYNDNQLDYESWTLDELTDPANNYSNFRIFYLVLNSENFVSESGDSATKNLLLSTRVEQQEIGKKFYADYSDARSSLISELWLKNPALREEPELCIEKSQKLLDRIVFCCFAEDSGFIPDATLEQVLKESSQSAFGSVWATLRSLFEAIDVGSDKLGIPMGYNGGLFKRDLVLDGLVIGDEPLRRLLRLGHYDFQNDLSVTILGHIFEQSITDIEMLIQAARAGEDFAAALQSKRKKDGIYYTPDHVVRTIVDESLGAHLRNLEALRLNEVGLSEKLSEAQFEKRQLVAYQRYLNDLLMVRVLDPACGSGAFLVAVFDYLMHENSRVQSILGSTLLANDEFIRPVLQSCIFGVDLNEESVEITKLSLWLKSATKGQKLTNLDANIKCGNSLIADDLVDPKAFRWDREFAEIIAAGGFDVVVGNPPYVDSELMVKTVPEQRNYIAKTFIAAQGNWDLFIPFYQHAFDLVKPGGYCSMIIPNKVLIASYGSALRKHITQKGSVAAITDLSSDRIFTVDVYPVILTCISGATNGEVLIRKGLFGEAHAKQLNPKQDNWGVLLADDSGTMKSNQLPLADLFDIFSAATVNEAYELKKVIKEDKAGSERKIVNTGTIDPYICDWGLFPMTYIKGKYQFPVAPVSIPQKHWEPKDKVIVAGMSQTLEAFHSRGNHYFPAKSTTVVIQKIDQVLDSYGALALLNSDIVRSVFVAQNQLNSMAGGYITINRVNLGKCLVPARVQDHAELLNNLGRELSAAATELYESSVALRDLLVSEYGDTIWVSKLKHWWLKDAAGVMAALGYKLPIEAKNQLLPILREKIVNAEKSFSKLQTAELKVCELLTDL